MSEYLARNHVNNLAKNIKPVLAYDGKEDFAAWQKKARTKLEELLGLPLEKGECKPIIKSEAETDAYKRIDFDFESEPGYLVQCSMLVPKKVQAPAPAVICLQGHSTGMHISLGEPKYENDAKSIAGGRDFAIRAVQEGFCAITLEQRYMGESGHGENGLPSCLGMVENTAAPALLIGRTAIGERVWDISGLIDVLENHFKAFADTSELICMGNSGGGTATFYASCMDERIKISMPSCAFCTFDASIMAMSHCPCNYIPHIRKYFNMGDMTGLIAPRKLVLVSGVKDPIFPIGAAEESFEITKQLYTAAGVPDLCYHVKGSGGHQFYPDDAWPIVHKLMQ
ncbi:MAG: hypothetical protein IJD83_07635 [Clostridia bacterium]|nr:hypothetical protein [Clostridia bacterium]